MEQWKHKTPAERYNKDIFGLFPTKLIPVH